MPENNQFKADLLDQIPIGITLVDSSSKILQCNEWVKRVLNVDVGACLLPMIEADSRAHLEEILVTPDIDVQVQFNGPEDTSYLRIRAVSPEEGRTTLIVRDVSEQMALSAQLQKSRQPERKFVHDISNALTTTLGYSELISMMLEEHEMLSGERLGAVQRYQAEVYSGLKRADELIKGQKQQAKRSLDPVTVPLHKKHVMVVDDEPAIAEFLAELLRARKYRVSPFTDSLAALEYFRSNIDNIDLVIMDQIMPEMSGITLATELLSVKMDLPIVLCTGDQMLIKEQTSGKLRIKHFISKPIDIDELTEMVSNIID